MRLEPWPVADEAKAKGMTAHITIQIDGKARGEMRLPTGASREEIEAAARTQAVARLEGKKVLRVIVVPDRLVNFVLEK